MEMSGINGSIPQDCHGAALTLFPSMETLEGYTRLLEDNGWEVIAADTLSGDFTDQVTLYLKRIRGELRPEITRRFGNGFYSSAEEGIALWEKAAHEGIVGRGGWIAR